MPEITRHPIELFLDIEGIPDQDFYYLIGILVHDNNNERMYSFWADTLNEEKTIWIKLLEIFDRYPEAPIYHYGNYETKSINKLSKKYQTNFEGIKQRLINVNSFIFDKLYFPIRSNRLKDLGKFVGATWSMTEPSGIQSLVWRYKWEDKNNSIYKRKLIIYNEEDCRALLLATNYISKIKRYANTLDNIDFVDEPKQHSTEVGLKIHEKFEHILKFAHSNYDKNKINVRKKLNTNLSKNKGRGAPKGHVGYARIIPSIAGKIIKVQMKRKCPKHKGEKLEKSNEISEKTIIDLHFSKNGCRKTITKYIGIKGYCSKCREYYIPPGIKKLDKHLFGHNFQAWAIYQRIILRLPYRVITQVMEDLFGERSSPFGIIIFMRNFAKQYQITEEILIRRILENPYIHIDETKINIEGIDHFVWVFTDGKHVVFKLTETREATIVHKVISDYNGIVISDFYPGYDSLTCKQQKCLVHLIRDLNNDLWKSPFNTEFESFIFEFKLLLVPIFEAIDKYGLRKWHFNKFKKSVNKFYEKNIINIEYETEQIKIYQKRFKRYKESLFTFLEFDNIPWNNNTAENALRHLAVQRKISGTFFKRTVPDYLLLLGIAQSCRFQGKSFLKFLLSKEKDVDKFKASRPLKISVPVSK